MLVPWIHIIWNIKNVTFELSCIRIDCNNSGVTYKTHRRWSKVKNYYGNKNSQQIIMSGIYIHREVKIPHSVPIITHIWKRVDMGPKNILDWHYNLPLCSVRATSPLGLGLPTEEPLIDIDCLFPTSNCRWRLLRLFEDMFLGNMYSICHFLYFIMFFCNPCRNDNFKIVMHLYMKCIFISSL